MKKQRLPIITIVTSISMLLSLFMNPTPASAARMAVINPPSTGAYTSGVYRNMFLEGGYTQSAIDTKVTNAWNSLFTGTDDNKRILYSFDADEAYIKDVANNDIRSEGMSYGMMIAVQLNKQAEFDKLWRFARTRMYQSTGPREGYFCWQANTSGTCIDINSAPDGEEYFAMALYFASHRWGDGTGILNYQAEADEIVREMMHQEDDNGGVVGGIYNMINKTQDMVVFVPYDVAAGYSDPSYHLPHFYHLFALWGPSADATEWNQARDRSRQYFLDSTNDSTCLGPDYANWNGSATGGTHADFRFDAWRIVSNWAVDYAWFAASANEKTLSDCYQSFLQSKGITTYANQWTLTGTSLSSDHSAGMVAQAAVGSLAATNDRAWLFNTELWNLAIPTGTYRYYDGVLYMMSLLHLSGKFQIYKPNLLANGGMESGTPPTSWSVNGAGTLSSDTTQFHSGTKSLKHSGRTASWNGPAQTVATSNLTNGQSRFVSVWVRSQTGTPTAKATLKLVAGTTTYLQLASATVNSTGWTLLTGTTTVSWTGTLTSALVYVETAAGTDNLYVDDFLFSK